MSQQSASASGSEKKFEPAVGGRINEPGGDPAPDPAGDPVGEPAGDPAPDPAGDPVADPGRDPVGEHVRWAVASWPQIDPEVEGIVVRVDKIHRHFQDAFRASLGDAGLTKEEWKVLMALHHAVRSHGWLCQDLDVSTGAMTNRLDKLEGRGLIRRVPDPNDRRGVLLELTDNGQSQLEEYVEAGAGRERELVDDLTPAEKRELNRLLSKLLVSLQAKNAGRVSPRSKRRP